MTFELNDRVEYTLEREIEIKFLISRRWVEILDVFVFFGNFVMSWFREVVYLRMCWLLRDL